MTCAGFWGARPGRAGVSDGGGVEPDRAGRGLRAVVIRLGRGFNGIAVEGTRVTAGAAALDARVAVAAAEAGVDLTFLRTIPGSIGGAVRMNAGCYGSYTADHLVSARAVTRGGARW
jgi:UDP-N-acetylmuramate dehydrogenase